MDDTGFVPTAEQRARLAPVHRRQADGTLVPTTFDLPIDPEFHGGGGALYSTGRDYLTFLQMLLHDGTLNGARILRPETLSLINRNHIGDLQAGRLPSRMPERAHDFELFPGMKVRWGLAYMLNSTGAERAQRRSGSWAGIFNSYYWLDPAPGRRRDPGSFAVRHPATARAVRPLERGVCALAEAR
jgi:CubicO group peptidase (beta-lactamase class C family)